MLFGTYDYYIVRCIAKKHKKEHVTLLPRFVVLFLK